MHYNINDNDNNLSSNKILYFLYLKALFIKTYRCPCLLLLANGSGLIYKSYSQDEYLLTESKLPICRYINISIMNI